MTKGINQYSDTDYANGNGKRVNLSFQVLASGTRANGILTVSKSKDQSSSAFGSWGVTSSNDFSGFKAGAFVVGVMNVSTNDSAGRWGSPRRELLLSRNDSERVFGNEVFSFEPANMDGLEGVMNFNSVACENELGMNHDYPHNCTNRNGVDDCDESFIDTANRKVRNSSESANEGDHCQIDPVTSGSKNVRVSHDGQTIADCNRVSSFSATKEGN